MPSRTDFEGFLPGFPLPCDSPAEPTDFLIKGWRPVALAFFVLAAGVASAAPVDVYQGRLGAGTEVVMELGAADADGARQGRYFYRRNGVDIPLSGKLNELAEALPLTDELVGKQGNDEFPLFADAKRRSVIWQARLEGDSLVGEWVDGIRGKKLPFNLKRIAHYDPEKIAPQGVEAVTIAFGQGGASGVAGGVAISARTTPYDFLRVSVPLDQGKEVVLSPNLAWRPVRDARTKLWYPRLSRHPDAKILAQANALLEQRHWAMNLDALACKSTLYQHRSPAAGSLGDFDKEEIKVNYLSPAVMSVVESGSTYCGGAHPNNHYDPFTLDLLRGGYMDFSRLLKGVSYGQYGAEYGNPLTDFVRKAVDKQTAKDDDTGCAEVLPDYLALVFEKPGQLAFTVSGIGHAMGACLGSGVSLPFSQLKPVLKPEATPYLKSEHP